MICQSDKFVSKLVCKPQMHSYQKILDIVKERGTINDGKYTELYRRLRDVDSQTLLMKQAFWHRSCYQDTTNIKNVRLARDRYEQALSNGSCSDKMCGRKRRRLEMEQSPNQSTPFTRSCTVPLNSNICFFCQEKGNEQLFKVCTENAGQALRSAVEKSQNPVFITRLNTSISPTDAHAIDIRYHKSCWRKHVFHVIREESESACGDVLPCLDKSKLIHLLDDLAKECKDDNHKLIVST